MLTALTIIILLAAGVAGWGMYLHSQATARRRVALREKLNRLAGDGPGLAMARFQRSLERARSEEALRARGITPGVARVQLELDSAEWESSRAR
jgi:hypothetical protein